MLHDHFLVFLCIFGKKLNDLDEPSKKPGYTSAIESGLLCKKTLEQKWQNLRTAKLFYES